MVSTERESRVLKRILNQGTEKCAFLEVKVNTGVLVATFWSTCHSQFCHCHASRLVKLAFSIRIPCATAEMVRCCVLFGKSQSVCKSQVADSS
jgi:hypothetical protein